MTRGINGTRLEAVRIGRRWYTTRDAVMRFGEALAAASVATLEARAATTPEPTTPKPRTAARRERDVEAAKAHLRASGLL